jgi:SAM-dependent methyltransferase
MAPDVFQALSAQDAAMMEMIVARMEMRARDPRFVVMRQAYLDAIDLASAKTVLDLGGGTGLDGRAAALRPEFKGRAVVSDLSAVMLDAGRRFAIDEGVGGRIEWRVEDATDVDLPDSAFDVVIMHTLVSHVAEPLAVLREAARLLAPHGRMVVFDADFASLSFGYPDAELAEAMEKSLLAAMVANPRVLRELPGLLQRAGLAITQVQPHVVADIGTGVFFPNFAESYAPVVARQGLLPQERVDAWLAEQRASQAEGRFFASCNYYAYIVHKA